MVSLGPNKPFKTLKYHNLLSALRLGLCQPVYSYKIDKYFILNSYSVTVSVYYHVACNIQVSCEANRDRNQLWAWLDVNNLWHTSFLSVQTNTKFTISWNRHADNVTKKANSKIGFLKRNIRSAQQAAKETAYN